jgi:hypothetical protein
MSAPTLIDNAPPETLDAIHTLVQDAEKALARGTEMFGRQYSELQARALARREGPGDGTSEITDPVSDFLGISYPWFDLIAIGPFQQAQPLGPFAPSRVIRAGEIAVLLAAVWRNPFPLPFGANPSAAQIMTGMQYTVRGETVNVSAVSNGPDLGPVTNTFGAGNVEIHPLVIPTAPAPQDGAPRLLDISLTIDVRSGTSGLPPFAGYASRWLNLDSVPPFLLGNVQVPGTVPGFINDTPVRVLVYS